MKTTFAFASGTVQGRDHRLQGRNNQDASCLLEREDVVVAVVCDGCGNGDHSEVGARLGAEAVAHLVAAKPWFDPMALTQELASFLRSFTPAFPGTTRSDEVAFVMEHLLFTIVGVVITAELATFFALGDGLIAINGEIMELGPFPDNAPPYLGYRLLSSRARDSDIRIVRQIPTRDVNTFLIGTDGIAHLHAAAEKNVPGKTDVIGPLSRLWTEDRFFQNRDMVRRHLALANQDALSVDWEAQAIGKEPGRLPDDTTLIVGRRKEI